jgi:hypothetical protein
MLTAAYHMFKEGTLYDDLGADHFDKRATAANKPPRQAPSGSWAAATLWVGLGVES